MPMQEQEQPKPHFLVVTYPAQGHINPARHLALRLMRATGALVTVSTAVSAYRKMFPSAVDDLEHTDGGVCYVPYSDGYDGGFDKELHDTTHYMSQVKLVGSRTVSAILARLRDGGRPVTCVVCTILLSWVVNVAQEHGVPAALYWIQPASVLAAYFHCFRGYDGVDKAIAAVAHDPWATVRIPGLPPLRVRDLPSFLTITSDDDPYAIVRDMFRDLIDTLALDDRPAVLANTFDAMEPEAVVSLRQHLDIVPVGPMLSFLDAVDAEKNSLSVRSTDLFKQDDKQYFQWLDTKPASSVVYISFGSLSVMSKRQISEIAHGMKQSGKSFLWVLRKDNRQEDDANSCDAACDGGKGMVVEWCDQVKVLSHPAVACFVTHCGWNSTLESIACGVPVVAVPQWTDQGTNAWLVEQLGSGVRATVNEKDGVLEAEELGRCLDFAMSEMVRVKAAVWKEKARAAVADGGSSGRNLRAFMVQMARDI